MYHPPVSDQTETSDAPATPEQMHKLEAQRRENRDKTAELGLDPYGDRVDGVAALADARAQYDADANVAFNEHGKEEGFADPRPTVTVAGRIVLHRDNGKLVWMNLRDASGDLQVAVSKRDCDEAGFGAAKLADLGDLAVVTGRVMQTKAGEVTVWASSVRPAGKCLVPPPEKHAGLTDTEARYRQRYVDLWASPETAAVFATRSRIVGTLRAFLAGEGFVEVETPMLQAQAGGAAARPFSTHLNALDIDLYLRIAPELYLKRLLVGGMPRVFEINRNFRNEGVDRSHNPEFTMCELYMAHGNVESVMDVTERSIRACAKMVAESQGLGAPTLPFGELAIDYARPFDRVRYGDLFEQALGCAMTDTDAVWAKADEHGAARKYARRLEAEGKPTDAAVLRNAIDPWIIVNELFEDVAEPTLDPARPTFITHYPAALSPLTRANREDPALADRSDLFIAGMEIGPHYTELNDPDVQAERFRAQLAGIDDEESTFRNFDEDFIRALKVGMPPAGGMGLGIDRLVMLLTDQRSIRDVVLFPFMRPE
ncbi:MAG: lysine--tRNA ligase [Phycisphaeraceae bacterium]|nr:MAG: lysine--tRNA ligase [Phycisphaeraceae bacterium]